MRNLKSTPPLQIQHSLTQECPKGTLDSQQSSVNNFWLDSGTCPVWNLAPHLRTSHAVWGHVHVTTAKPVVRKVLVLKEKILFISRELEVLKWWHYIQLSTNQPFPQRWLFQLPLLFLNNLWTGKRKPELRNQVMLEHNEISRALYTQLAKPGSLNTSI